MTTVKSNDSAATAELAARLQDTLERGERQLLEVESSLAGALDDHDTLQEDQNGLRALVETIRLDVEQTRRALARLDSGTYGRCRSCNEPIAPARLDAMPAAERCARCA